MNIKEFKQILVNFEEKDLNENEKRFDYHFNRFVYLGEENKKHKILGVFNYIFDNEIEMDREELVSHLMNELNFSSGNVDGFDVEVSFVTDEEDAPEIMLPVYRFLGMVEKENREIIKETLKNSDNINIYNHPEAKKKFYQLADAQRGFPEAAMLKCQKVMGGGVLSHQLEHIGDLTHRISQRVYIESDSIESALNDIGPKINRGIASLTHPYGFEKEHKENMLNNYDYFSQKDEYLTFESYKLKVKERLDEYVQKHKELPVYNEFQYFSREAAIQLGSLNFENATRCLKHLNEIVEAGKFIEKASGYKEKYSPSKKLLDKIVFNDCKNNHKIKMN